MKKVCISIITILCVMLSLLSACEKSVDVTGIYVEEEKIILAVDEKAYISANVLPETATDNKLEYISSNEDIAEVKNGMIYGVSEGECKITVKTKSNGYEKSVDVTVIDNVLSVSKGYGITDELYGKYRFRTISEALAAAEDGDVIKVERGIYDEYVNVTKNVTLCGNGVTIDGTVCVGSPTLETPVRDVLISDISFNYNGVTPCIILGGESQNVTISDCDFYSRYSSGYAISTDKTGESSALSSIKVLNSVFDGFEYAVRFNKYVAKCEIKEVTVKNTKSAIYLEGSQKTTVKNSKFIASGMFRLKAARVLASDMVFEGNVVESGYGDEPIIIARKGDIEKTCKIDISENVFFGKKVSEMTDEEIYDLKSKIEVKNELTGEGGYDMFVFKKK